SRTTHDLHSFPTRRSSDLLPVSVRVQSTGMAGQTAKVVIELGEERAEKEIAFTGDGEQVVTVGITPKKPGDFQLKASVPPREDRSEEHTSELQSPYDLVCR